MRRSKKCDCNRGVIKFKHIKPKLNGSVIELKCTKCKKLIGWWHTQAEKIMPIKRTWSKKECLAMR
jgi:hypothetical protein